MITNPSLSDMDEERWTKISGKEPRVNVMIKLITIGVKAPSLYISETNMDRNMNNALTRSAKPTFLLIAL